MDKIEYEERIEALEKEVRIMKERYQILAETTPALLFEYRPDEDKMIFIFNFPDDKSRREIENYHQYVKHSPLVHPNHLEMFMDVLYKASISPMRGELEYLSKVTGDEFQWHRTYYSSIADKDGKVISVLGRIQNIHKSETARQELIHRAETDFLTGLYNKETAMDKIGRWLKSHPTGEAYMIMLDLDNFKQINDDYGHSFGDEILKGAGMVISQCFEENSLVSRFGGDEFIIFVMEEHLGMVKQRADILVQKLAEMSNNGDKPLRCSMGVAGRVSRYDDFEDLFNRADNAMYQAKKGGKNQCCVYKEQ